MTKEHAATEATVRRLITELLPPSEKTNPGIFGPGGALDSLGLVNFLADLEYRLEAEFGLVLVLASEQAMSRQRSPFRDVEALTSYVMELINQ